MAITPRYCFFLTADREAVLFGFEDLTLAAAAFLAALSFAEAASSFLCLIILNDKLLAIVLTPR